MSDAEQAPAIAVAVFPGSNDDRDTQLALERLGAYVTRVWHAEESLPAATAAVVVTSDHGEAFGEHGMYRHGYELWEELVHVPLIVHLPGVAPQRQAARRSAIDLAPTLLELFGMPLPAGEQRLSGVSLLADIFASPGQTPAERAVFIDMSAGPYNEERQALIDQDLKLVTSAGRPLGLYDLARDPGEKADRQRDAQLLEVSLQRLAAFKSQLRTVVVKP